MLLPRSSVPVILFMVFAVASVLVLLSLETQYGINQAVFFALSGLIFLGVSSFPVLTWYRLRWPMYLGTLFLLVAVLVIGRTTNGAVSWIRFGTFRFQPSEILKPVLFWMLAWESLALRQNGWQWKSMLRWSILAVAPIICVLLQPDLGTTLMISVGVACIALLARPPRWLLLSVVSSGGVILTLAWLFLLQPFQKARILNFLDPQRDPLGSGYNARQSLIAVGSGQTWGLGLGNGLQSTLRFLPERQTDFLFATYSESTGFVGSSALVLLYAALFWYWSGIPQRVAHPAAKVFIWASWAMLFAQTTVNIGMNIGLLPITGVTLPLFSLGGTSLISTAVFAGLFESLRRSDLPNAPIKTSYISPNS